MQYCSRLSKLEDISYWHLLIIYYKYKNTNLLFMSKLAKLRDSEDEISFKSLIELLNHNIASKAFIRSETVTEVIERMNPKLYELEYLLDLINEWLQKYQGRRLEKEYDSLKNLSNCVKDKIKFFWISNWVKKDVVETLDKSQLWRRASRKARASHMEITWINQTRANRLKENQRRFPEIPVITEIRDETQEKVYNLLVLPEEEWKIVFGAYKYYKKLMSQKYITKSELMGLKDFIERATIFLDRFPWVIPKDKMNNLKNRMKMKVNKCPARMLSSDLQVEYEKFIKLISVK